MNSKTIKEWLDNISTRIGASVSGDMTLSYDEVEKIIDYIKNLENALDEIEKYIEEHKIKHYKLIDEPDGIDIILLENEIDDLKEIIKKAKGE